MTGYRLYICRSVRWYFPWHVVAIASTLVPDPTDEVSRAAIGDYSKAHTTCSVSVHFVRTPGRTRWATTCPVEVQPPAAALLSWTHTLRCSPGRLSCRRTDRTWRPQTPRGRRSQWLARGSDEDRACIVIRRLQSSSRLPSAHSCFSSGSCGAQTTSVRNP